MGLAAAVVAGAAVAAGGSMIASSNQADAAENAANTQANAADRASQTQLDMYNQSRSDLAPYRDTGTGALYSLASMYGLGTPDYTDSTNGFTVKGNQPGSGAAPDYSAFYKSPDYNFSLDQGVQALDRSAASRGTLLSGGQMKDITGYGQGLASQQFGNYFNRLAALAGIGQSATNTGTQAGQQTAAGVASTQLAAGAGRASGYVGAANALSGGLQTGLNNGLSTYNFLNNNFGGGTSGQPFENYNNSVLDNYNANFQAPTMNLSSAEMGLGG